MFFFLPCCWFTVEFIYLSKFSLSLQANRSNSYHGFNGVHSASGSKFGEEDSELKAASFFLLLLLVMLWLPLISLWSCFLQPFESIAVCSDGVPWSCLLRTVSLAPWMDPLITALPPCSHPIAVAGSRACFQEQRQLFPYGRALDKSSPNGEHFSPWV